MIKPTRSIWMAIGALTLVASLASAPASAKINRIKGNPNAIILDGVTVSDDMEHFFLSGQLPSPIDAKKPMSEVKSIEEMGDSKTQTISTLNKIKTLLAAQGYEMSDLIKLSLFVAADPRLGKMDFAGVNEGFRQFFGTSDNPNTVARSTFQVAALVGPYYLIEIEAIAAKKRPGPSADSSASDGVGVATVEGSEEPDAFKRRIESSRYHRLPPALRKTSRLG